MEEDLIKVLWIEDGPVEIEAYPQEAEMHGLALHPFPCWDDAKDALERDFASWDAIILDAKCKQHRDSADNATKFLSEALSGLRVIFAKNNRTINWYILSGGSEDELNDSILDDRKAWDGDWPKLYYSKSTDRVKLFERIKEHVTLRSEETQVKTVYFRDVFEAIRESGLDATVENNMLSLLVPVVFPDKLSSSDYNNRLKEARMTVEHIFRGMIRMGMMPPSLGNNRNKIGAVNLTWCCQFVSGKMKDAAIDVCENIFPRIINNVLFNIVNTTGSSVHTEGDSNATMVNFNQYQAGTGETSYLLKSFAFQLCDIILWFNNYIKAHPDPIENGKNWVEF